MNHRKILLISFFFFISIYPMTGLAEMSEQEAAIQFMEAGSFYKAGDYQAAIDIYENILLNDRVSGSLYFNLGNSYYRVGRKGKAILNYERAKQFIPRDSDLIFNDRYVRGTIGNLPLLKNDNVFFQFWRQFYNFYTKEEMVLIITALAMIVCLIQLLSTYFRWQNSLKSMVTYSVIVIFCVYGVGLALKMNENKNNAIVILTADSRFEPRDDSTVHFKLQQGSKVKVLKMEGDWTKIKRRDGKLGWIKFNALERI